MTSPETGVSALDPARALLAGLDDAPVAEHATTYADVQQRLQAALAALDHL